MSIVRPKLRKSYHYVEKTKQGVVKSYSDHFEVAPRDENEGNAFPTKDAAGNGMTPDYGYLHYDDNQSLVIQELPENAPPGQLPRSIKVILDGQLVDTTKPGDRIEVTGVYKTVSGQKSSHTGVFETVLIAIGIEQLKMENKL